MSPEPLHPVVFVGAGAVSRHLIPWFQQHGLVVSGIISQRLSSATSLQEAYDLSFSSSSLTSLPSSTQLIALAVPDKAIAEVAQQLAQLPFSWRHKTVLHFSGSMPASLLAPLADKGATILSFHPLQTFPSTHTPPSLKHIYVGIEGPPAGIDQGQQLARLLSWHPLILRPEVKPLYHLAATVASNFLVTLIALSTEIGQATGISEQTFRQMLYPLLLQTLKNLQQSAPEKVLTGPVARGDLPTIEQHLQLIKQQIPHLLPTISALIMETVRIAIRGHQLLPDEGDAILEAVDKSLYPDRENGGVNIQSN